MADGAGRQGADEPGNYRAQTADRQQDVERRGPVGGAPGVFVCPPNAPESCPLTVPDTERARTGRARGEGSATMLIARLDGVGLRYGTRQIFAGLSLSLNDGEKIGLVGPNGAGKSSLLKLLVGIERADSGERTLRRGVTVAYLAQEYAGTGAACALDEVLLGRPDLLALEGEMAASEAALADPALADDFDALGRAVERQTAAIEAYEKGDGQRFRDDARGLLDRLGLPGALQAEPLAVLSGGQRKLVGLARCLLTRPDLLLLDEPDNHLDLAGKELLEAVLRDFKGATILISHDRYLLDDTIAQIAAHFAPPSLTRSTPSRRRSAIRWGSERSPIWPAGSASPRRSAPSRRWCWAPATFG